MFAIENASEKLNQKASRYQSLKEYFNNFQKIIQIVNESDFPVSGISVKTADSTKSYVSYLDRSYVITFSFSVADYKGIISFCRLSDQGVSLIGVIHFDGQGNTDANQPAGEDIMNIKVDGCCLNLLFNWLLLDKSTT